MTADDLRAGGVVSDGRVQVAIPDPRERPTISVEEAGALFGFHKTKSYAEANRFLATDGAEGLPVIRFGRTLRVPTARLLALLGLGLNGADDHHAISEDDGRVQAIGG